MLNFGFKNLMSPKRKTVPKNCQCDKYLNFKGDGLHLLESDARRVWHFSTEVVTKSPMGLRPIWIRFGFSIGTLIENGLNQQKQNERTLSNFNIDASTSLQYFSAHGRHLSLVHDKNKKKEEMILHSVDPWCSERVRQEGDSRG